MGLLFTDHVQDVLQFQVIPGKDGIVVHMILEKTLQ